MADNDHSHDWRFVGITDNGDSIMRCFRCGESKTQTPRALAEARAWLTT